MCRVAVEPQAVRVELCCFAERVVAPIEVEAGAIPEGFENPPDRHRRPISDLTKLLDREEALLPERLDQRRFRRGSMRFHGIVIEYGYLSRTSSIH